MAIRVEASSSVPIYEQIADQIVFAVAAGDLAPGDLVPSVRDLSVQLTVNPNTVVRAYQELENLGVLEPLRGRGMTITPDGSKRCRQRRKERLQGRVEEIVREAVSAGLGREELRDLIDAHWPTPGRNGTSAKK